MMFSHTLRGLFDSMPSKKRWPEIAASVLFASLCATSTHAATTLADTPVFSTIDVPGNLVLALSVEFPTAVTAADRTTTYSANSLYLGYFDSAKCYAYTTTDTTYGSYFRPVGAATSTHTCTGNWSGNFLNWATMQAVDPFRSALTGGYRSVSPPSDTATMTILEKAVAPSNQGSSSSNFPNKSLTSGVSSVTPFSFSSLYMHVVRCGNTMVFSQSNNVASSDNCPASTAWDGVTTPSSSTVYSLQVRVQVCVPTMLESNCVAYGTNYKPQGLIQQYAQKIRFSAFGYLNDPTPTGGSMLRDGGVLRARMKFVGPTQPVPGSSPITNAVGATSGQVTSAEWSATDGTFVGNPDAADATASSETGSVIAKSGVINYLNQFGLGSQAYKYYDPVSELYYAATRYLRGLGGVASYSDLSVYNGGGSTAATRTLMKDGFPVITNTTDPVLYSCQKNFVLGIGDTNTNQDKDLPGNTSYRAEEPSSIPPEVSSDTVNALDATNKVGMLEGMGSTIANTNSYNTSDNSAYIAGLAYLFHTTPFRPDLSSTQTLATFWLDVLEGGDYKPGLAGRNQFYLAAKYGGFTVPSGYSYASNTASLASSLWATTTDTVPIPSAGGPRPDNYFVANQADKMVAGLTTAFQKIASAVSSYSNSFGTALPQVTSAGAASYSTQYDPATWTGEVTANLLTFDSSGLVTTSTPQWTFSTNLANQLKVTGSVKGWDTNRRVVTWNGSTGVAFRSSGSSALASTDLATLDTSYVSGNDSANYLNYLRGDQSNESGVAGGTQAYRARTKLLGDIVGSAVTVVGTPSYPFGEATNTGYTAFKTQWTTTTPRPSVVYVGANDGMLHAIDGAFTTSSDSMAGQELFAYVPEVLFQGPNGTPNVDGLASLGNPSFVHHYFLNATPKEFDLDLSRTAGVLGTAAPNWASVLIGGLGKGGRGYYALNVTDPASMAANESAAASKVMWEFNNNTAGVAGALGFSYGDPIVVKTKQYGWTVILTSGYNNADGKGYIFFVNPANGALLQKVTTNVGSTTNDAGLAHANAFVVDSTDGTADAVYAGDLLGNLWRVDVTATTGSFPAPTLLARLTDSSGNAQPVTIEPDIEVSPTTKQRFVMIGTGRLLATSDIASTQTQTFYSIVDGSNAAFSPTGSASVSFPYARASLVNDTLSTTVGVTSTPIGWYQDLGLSSSGIGYRIVSNLASSAGFVAFSATVPNGQACTPQGSSNDYVLNYANGVSVLRANDNVTALAYVSISDTSNGIQFYSANGKLVVVTGSSNNGSVSNLNIAPLSTLQLRRLNWRELPVTN